MQKLKLDKWIAILWVFLGVLLLLLMRNAFFAHPVADDYCYAVKAMSFGSWFDAVANEYKSWGGRYSATALMSIFALNFNLINDFWMIPIILILFTTFSFYIFYSSLNYVAGQRKDWLNWGAFGFCVYIAIMPEISEIFYFMATGITYTFGYGLILVILGIIIRLSFARISKAQRLCYISILPISVILVPGFSEVAGLLLILFLFYIVTLTFYYRGRNLYVYSLAFVVSIVGLAIVASAPGNEARMASLGGGGVKWLTPFYGIYKAIGVLLLTVLIMYILTANNFVLETMNRLSGKLSERLGGVTWQRSIVFVLSVLVLYAAVYMPSYWAAGSSAEGRTKTILYILPFMFCIPAITILLPIMQKKFAVIGWIGVKRTFTAKLSIVVLFLVVMTMNIKDIVIDAYWRGNSYNKQLLNRYVQIEEARKSGQQDLVVANLYDLPKSLYFGDILVDSEHWRNQCYKNYFKLRSIKVIK